MYRGLSRGLQLVSPKRGRALAVLASSVLIWSAVAVSADATSPSNNFASSITTPVLAGYFYGTQDQSSTRNPIDLRVTVNSSYNQQIGSMQITAPSSVLLYAAPTVTVAGASLTSTNVVWVGQVVTLNNLAAQPGQQIDVYFSGDVQCAATATPSPTWGIVAKQANAFNGLPGNTVNGPSPTQAVNGNCSLTFVKGSTGLTAADAAVKTVITTKPYGTTLSSSDPTDYPSAGDPVTVEVLNGGGTSLEWATRWNADTGGATINLGLNPASPSTGGTLSGGTSASTLSTSATQTFTPSVTVHGTGYSLAASVTVPSGNSFAEGTAGATSDEFNIVDNVGVCTTVNSVVTCTPTTAASGSTHGAVTPQGASSGDYTVLSVGDPASNFSCSGTTGPGASAAIAFTILNAAGTASGASKIAEIRLDNPTKPASKYVVCWESTTQFTTAGGGSASGPDSAGNYTGLLPTCSNKYPAPCVSAAYIDRTVSPTQLVMDVTAPAGDPGAKLY